MRTHVEALEPALGLGPGRLVICAAVGQGTHPSCDAAVAAMTRPAAGASPDPAAHAAYDGLLEVFAEVSPAVDPVRRRSPGGAAARRPR